VKEHEFTLSCSAIGQPIEEASECLYEAGCSDATICLRGGRFYITFSRAAESRSLAILSATNAVRKACIGDGVIAYV
jgi:hypothetical protein